MMAVLEWVAGLMLIYIIGAVVWEGIKKGIRKARGK